VSNAYLILDESSEREEIEEIGKIFPYISIAIFAQAFIVETVDLSDLARFVVATKNRDALFVSNFQRHQQCDSLDRIIAAIDVVAHEQVIGVCKVKSKLQQATVPGERPPILNNSIRS
jgi:hypothetical protein